MSNSAPTALDRYRDAKLALDTFDAFTKRWERGEWLAYAPMDSKIKLAIDASITSQDSRNIVQNQGFNHFMREAMKAQLPDLFVAYRATLVERIKTAYTAALKEAAALIEETPPA